MLKFDEETLSAMHDSLLADADKGWLSRTLVDDLIVPGSPLKTIVNDSAKDMSRHFADLVPKGQGFERGLISNGPGFFDRMHEALKFEDIYQRAPKFEDFLTAALKFEDIFQRAPKFEDFLTAALKFEDIFQRAPKFEDLMSEELRFTLGELLAPSSGLRSILDDVAKNLAKDLTENVAPPDSGTRTMLNEGFRSVLQGADRCSSPENICVAIMHAAPKVAEHVRSLNSPEEITIFLSFVAAVATVIQAILSWWAIWIGPAQGGTINHVVVNNFQTAHVTNVPTAPDPQCPGTGGTTDSQATR